MRRLIVSCALVAAASCPAPAGADATGPPFDRALGAADRFTGLLGQVTAQSGAPRILGLPGVEAPVDGLVGIERSSGPGLAHGSAEVDVLRSAIVDLTAMLCIQISGGGLPNLDEGGGPVCQPLFAPPLADDPARINGVATQVEGTVRLDVYAELAQARDVNVDVFLSSLSHPVETGGTLAAARVTRISFDPAAAG